jgi:signal transduction histidine kinase
MFQYFLVFSGEENDLALQDYDGHTLLSQMLSEHVILLRESGFTVETEYPERMLYDAPCIRTDAPHCMRIVDNVFSNITKYTAKEEPILLRFGEDKTSVSVEFRNAIRADADLAESTGIGLKTCARIAKLLRCEFTTEEQDGYFTARLVLPKSSVNPSNL